MQKSAIPKACKNTQKQAQLGEPVSKRGLADQYQAPAGRVQCLKIQNPSRPVGRTSTQPNSTMGEAVLKNRQPPPKPVGRALSVEGVFQMVYILPERLLALVRPAFDLVLRRIRSLKRCVQACGCKIETPRYACNLAPGCISSEPTFAGLRKTKKKKTRGPKKRGPRKKGKRGFLWQSLTSLEMQPGAKLRRISRGLYFAATRLHAAF